MLANAAVRMASCTLQGGSISCRRATSRVFHSCSSVRAISPLRMPALSPTMEAGQISRWNLEPGARFNAGDILLTVETDKAEVDVEAQDEGYMGPQLVPARTSIKVGEVIAVLGEDAEEINGNVDIPAAWKSPAESTSPNATQVTEDKIHSSSTSAGACGSGSSETKERAAKYANLHPVAKMPLSPAVSRILMENQIGDATGIQATGLNGRLTKGDVLHHLGIVSSPVGSAQKMLADDARSRALEKSSASSATSTAGQTSSPPMDGPTLRRLITEGLTTASRSVTRPKLSESPATFASILEDYHPAHRTSEPARHILPPSFKDSYLDGLTP